MPPTPPNSDGSPGEVQYIRRNMKGVNKVIYNTSFLFLLYLDIKNKQGSFTDFCDVISNTETVINDVMSDADVVFNDVMSELTSLNNYLEKVTAKKGTIQNGCVYSVPNKTLPGKLNRPKRNGNYVSPIRKNKESESRKTYESQNASDSDTRVSTRIGKAQNRVDSGRRRANSCGKQSRKITVQPYAQAPLNGEILYATPRQPARQTAISPSD